MSKIDQKAREAIAKLTVMPETIISCKVISVDDAKATCNVDLMDGRERFNVRLRASVDDSLEGAILWPKVGTYVLIGMLTGSKNYGVIMVSEAERITWKMGNTTLDADDTDVVFNGGTLGGMVKVNTLLTKSINWKQE